MLLANYFSFHPCNDLVRLCTQMGT